MNTKAADIRAAAEASCERTLAIIEQGQEIMRTLHGHRAASFRTTSHQEDSMPNYTPPDPYAPDIAKIRAATATPASRFAEEYAATRTKELADSRAASAAITPRARPRLTAAEVGAVAPPNGYQLALDAMKKEGR